MRGLRAETPWSRSNRRTGSVDFSTTDCRRTLAVAGAIAALFWASTGSAALSCLPGTPRIPGVVGIGIGKTETGEKLEYKVFVKELTPTVQAAVPKTIDGVPVSIEVSGEFVVRQALARNSLPNILDCESL